MTIEFEIPKELQAGLRGAWIRYLDLVEPLRNGLHRYCRRLTGNVWDAEDLAQETLLRAFGSLGAANPEVREVRNPRSYLLRIATNLWIDVVRRRQTEGARAPQAAQSEEAMENPGLARDAGATLFERLAPQERAAVMLKDVFDLSLAEIAELLQTTAGAVKSALHRGRTRLKEPEASARHDAPPRELVDRFVDAFNARDLGTLTALLLENASAEVVGFGLGQGRNQLASRNGWLQKSLFGHEPWALDQQKPALVQRAECVLFQGEPIVALWRTREDGEKVEEFWRFEEKEGRVARILDYCFCPETLTEIATILGFTVRLRGYRLPDQVIEWDTERRNR